MCGRVPRAPASPADTDGSGAGTYERLHLHALVYLQQPAEGGCAPFVRRGRARLGSQLPCTHGGVRLARPRDCVRSTTRSYVLHSTHGQSPCRSVDEPTSLSEEIPSPQTACTANRPAGRLSTGSTVYLSPSSYPPSMVGTASFRCDGSHTRPQAQKLRTVCAAGPLRKRATAAGLPPSASQWAAYDRAGLQLRAPRKPRCTPRRCPNNSAMSTASAPAPRAPAAASMEFFSPSTSLSEAIASLLQESSVPHGVSFPLEGGFSAMLQELFAKNEQQASSPHAVGSERRRIVAFAFVSSTLLEIRSPALDLRLS
eukprot:358796-Chlamydomonas_euryale.AAC.9